MSDILADVSVEEYLAHYGVKGMKWGVRKKDDTSTDRATTKQEKRNERAKKYDARAATYQSKIDELQAKRGVTNALNRRLIDRQIRDFSEERERALDDASRVRDGKLTKTQKKVAIGAAAVATILVARATYKMADSGEFTRLSTKGKAYMEGRSATAFKRNELLASQNLDVAGIQLAVVRGINPDYGAPGTMNNCRRATFAYEMRRRGYDVAATKTISSTGQDAAGVYNALTPGQKSARSGRVGIMTTAAREMIDESRGRSTKPFISFMDSNGGPLGTAKKITTDDSGYREAIFKSLSDLPDGARGELGMVWKAGGGHSMAWEVVKGKPVIFDTQNGKTYRTASDIAKVADAMAEAGFTRLDNVALNKDFLLKWVKEVG